MTFEEWFDEDDHDIYNYPNESMKDAWTAAWNAAIDAAAIAVENSDHNDDDSGISANCNAMIAVERLKIDKGK